MSLWTIILIWALIAAVLVAIINRGENIERLRQMPWYRLPFIAALMWGGFAVVLIFGYWADYYSYFIPPYVKWFAPTAALTYFAVAFLLRWFALRLPGNPIIIFFCSAGWNRFPNMCWGFMYFTFLRYQFSRI